MQETISQVTSANLPTAWGEFQILGFERELRVSPGCGAKRRLR
jgi:hypothetical protein